MGKYEVHTRSLPVKVDMLRRKTLGAFAEVTPDMLLRPWEEIHYRLHICRAKSEIHI
jgi:hypothetical protein